MSVYPFSSVLIMLFAFYLLSSKSALKVFEFENILSLFHRATVFNLNKVHLSFFYFMDCALGVVTKNSLPNSRQCEFVPMISSTSFTVLYLYLGP